MALIGTARICGAEPMKRSDVRLSVHPSLRLSLPAWTHNIKPAAGCLLLWNRRAGDNDRLLLNSSGVWRANAGSRAYHIVSIRRKQNTDLLTMTEKAHVACNFSCIVETRVIFKVTGCQNEVVKRHR